MLVLPLSSLDDNEASFTRFELLNELPRGSKEGTAAATAPAVAVADGDVAVADGDAADL